ncbi:hypothetical protein VUR80DRAFT_2360 [Thermomyces stellatus]
MVSQSAGSRPPACLDRLRPAPGEPSDGRGETTRTRREGTLAELNQRPALLAVEDKLTTGAATGLQVANERSGAAPWGLHKRRHIHVLRPSLRRRTSAD